MGLGLLFPILLLAMGIYVLVGAIKGEGRLFTMENFKDDCIPKAKKTMRILYFALAAIMLLMAIVNGLQTVLFSNKVSYYRVTDAYRETFPDLIENGELTYTTKETSSGGMSCFGASQSTGKEVTYGPYSVDDQKMDTAEISAFLNKAYDVYGNDREKFPLVSGGLMSCGGSTVDYQKYLEQTDLLDDAGNPVYAQNEAEAAKGHVVYISSIGGAHSDAKDGSFVSKLYGFLNPKVLSILNYVLLGLAVIGVVLIFVVTRKYTDKEKLAKARAQTQGYQSSMPSSAFVFDDEKTEEKTEKK